MTLQAFAGVKYIMASDTVILVIQEVSWLQDYKDYYLLDPAPLRFFFFHEIGCLGPQMQENQMQPWWKGKLVINWNWLLKKQPKNVTKTKTETKAGGMGNSRPWEPVCLHDF